MKRILLIIFCSVLFSFSTGDSKSEYILPLKANSVCVADIDLDGDNDILVGHNYNSTTQWSGVSIMLNDGSGHFDLYDSIYLYGGQPQIEISNLNENPLPEIIGKYVSTNPVSEFIAVIYDFEMNNINYFNLFTVDGIYNFEIGDINGDSSLDIVVASNGGKFWGVLYNDGTGNFSEPEYHDTELNPNDLAVGDIDSNGRDDIAIAGSDTEIYYSFETGFEKFTFSGYEHSIELADMDNDGDMDVITIWGAFVTTYIVYENLDYQNFQQHNIHTFESATGGLRAHDLNNDSLPEISLMKGDKYYILYNQGELIFSEPDSVMPDFIGPQTYTWADVDNNNYSDIVIVRDLGTYLTNLKILFNDGNGNFVENPITEIKSTKVQELNSIRCYPNPFTTQTTIEINIGKNEFAELSIYNLSGKKVKTLTNKITEGGIVIIKWDGLDNGDKPCKPGLYLLTLKVNGNVLQTIKSFKY
jgi:hypothetical protein